LRRKEEKSEEKRTTTQTKNEKSKFFHVVRLHFIRAPKAVVEGKRGVNAERKREKERDRQRETFIIASGGFRRFLSFFLSERQQEEEETKEKNTREFLITLDVGEAPGREKRRGSQHHFRERKRNDEYSRKQSKRYKRPARKKRRRRQQQRRENGVEHDGNAIDFYRLESHVLGPLEFRRR
jgi:hypothetical protein